jgi:S1-C subfamily serine protease
MSLLIPSLALAGALFAGTDQTNIPQRGIQDAQWTGSAAAQPAPIHHPPIGPGRPCDGASLSDPHVYLICTDDRLAKDWLVMNQAGYALRHQMGDAAYLPLMRAQGAAAWTALRTSCPVAAQGAGYDVASCIEGHILRQRSWTLSRLDRLASEEATRDIYEHMRLQETLADLHYLQGTADGMFGPATRDAILSFQRDHGLVASGFMTLETAQTLLHPGGVQAFHTPPPTILPSPTVGNPKPHLVATGTAFFITSEGDLLTNAHVVKDCEAITVAHGTAEPRAARVLARDETNDLAIISSGLTPTSVAALRSGVRLGEQVAVYGFPLTGLLASGGNFTLGNVTALAGVHDDTRILQISAPVQPGNSGGPLLDESGAVVGIVVAKLNAIKLAMATEDLAQNVNFAIKATTAQAFIETHGLSIRLASASGTPLRPADLADKARSFTALVKCVH